MIEKESRARGDFHQCDLCGAGLRLATEIGQETLAPIQQRAGGQGSSIDGGESSNLHPSL